MDDSSLDFSSITGDPSHTNNIAAAVASASSAADFNNTNPSFVYDVESPSSREGGRAGLLRAVVSPQRLRVVAGNMIAGHALHAEERKLNALRQKIHAMLQEMHREAKKRMVAGTKEDEHLTDKYRDLVFQLIQNDVHTQHENKRRVHKVEAHMDFLTKQLERRGEFAREQRQTLIQEIVSLNEQVRSLREANTALINENKKKMRKIGSNVKSPSSGAASPSQFSLTKMGHGMASKSSVDNLSEMDDNTTTTDAAATQQRLTDILASVPPQTGPVDVSALMSKQDAEWANFVHEETEAKKNIEMNAEARARMRNLQISLKREQASSLAKAANQMKDTVRKNMAKAEHEREELKKQMDLRDEAHVLERAKERTALEKHYQDTIGAELTRRRWELKQSFGRREMGLMFAEDLRSQAVEKMHGLDVDLTAERSKTKEMKSRLDAASAREKELKKSDAQLRSELNKAKEMRHQAELTLMQQQKELGRDQSSNAFVPPSATKGKSLQRRQSYWKRSPRNDNVKDNNNNANSIGSETPRNLNNGSVTPRGSDAGMGGSGLGLPTPRNVRFGDSVSEFEVVAGGLSTLGGDSELLVAKIKELESELSMVKGQEARNTAVEVQSAIAAEAQRKDTAYAEKMRMMEAGFSREIQEREALISMHKSVLAQMEEKCLLLMSAHEHESRSWRRALEHRRSHLIDLESQVESLREANAAFSRENQLLTLRAKEASASEGIVGDELEVALKARSAELTYALSKQRYEITQLTTENESVKGKLSVAEVTLDQLKEENSVLKIALANERDKKQRNDMETQYSEADIPKTDQDEEESSDGSKDKKKDVVGSSVGVQLTTSEVMCTAQLEPRTVVPPMSAENIMTASAGVSPMSNFNSSNDNLGGGGGSASSCNVQNVNGNVSGVPSPVFGGSASLKQSNSGRTTPVQQGSRPPSDGPGGSGTARAHHFRVSRDEYTVYTPNGAVTLLCQEVQTEPWAPTPLGRISPRPDSTTPNMFTVPPSSARPPRSSSAPRQQSAAASVGDTNVRYDVQTETLAGHAMAPSQQQKVAFTDMCDLVSRAQKQQRGDLSASNTHTHPRHRSPGRHVTVTSGAHVHPSWSFVRGTRSSWTQTGEVCIVEFPTSVMLDEAITMGNTIEEDSDWITLVPALPAVPRLSAHVFDALTVPIPFVLPVLETGLPPRSGETPGPQPPGIRNADGRTILTMQEMADHVNDGHLDKVMRAYDHIKSKWREATLASARMRSPAFGRTFVKDNAPEKVPAAAPTISATATTSLVPTRNSPPRERLSHQQPQHNRSVELASSGDGRSASSLVPYTPIMMSREPPALKPQNNPYHSLKGNQSSPRAYRRRRGGSGGGGGGGSGRFKNNNNNNNNNLYRSSGARTPGEYNTNNNGVAPPGGGGVLNGRRGRGLMMQHLQQDQLQAPPPNPSSAPAGTNYFGNGSGLSPSAVSTTTTRRFL
eukprot:PhM_4_TR8378/c9_g1_i1/m.65953